MPHIPFETVARDLFILSLPEITGRHACATVWVDFLSLGFQEHNATKNRTLVSKCFINKDISEPQVCTVRTHTHAHARVVSFLAPVAHVTGNTAQSGDSVFFAGRNYDFDGCQGETNGRYENLMKIRHAGSRWGVLGSYPGGE